MDAVAALKALLAAVEAEHAARRESTQSAAAHTAWLGTVETLGAAKANARSAVRAAEGQGAAKPFSTYPEDRGKLLSLSEKIQARNTTVEDTLVAADKLSDLVRAILIDEAA